jgi:hypothetical protein
LGQVVRETLSQKYPTQNRAGEVAQVVEYLFSKHEALSSRPQYYEKKKKRIEVQRGEVSWKNHSLLIRWIISQGCSKTQ